jgi:hypothetical protein
MEDWSIFERARGLYVPVPEHSPPGHWCHVLTVVHGGAVHARGRTTPSAESGRQTSAAIVSSPTGPQSQFGEITAARRIRSQAKEIRA